MTVLFLCVTPISQKSHLTPSPPNHPRCFARPRDFLRTASPPHFYRVALRRVKYRHNASVISRYLYLGLKEKYNCLEKDDPQRVSICTVVSLSRSIRKIARVFARASMKQGKKLFENTVKNFKQGIIAI